jgi:miniconductance mechanosensitive channel
MGNSRPDSTLRDPASERRSTNIEIFRAHVEFHVAAHPRIAKDKTRLVRQLQSSPQGLPLDVYCFDRLIAIPPGFGLSPFQEPSRRDMRAGLASRKLEA